MADARLTQAPVLALSDGEAPVRLTQAPVLVLAPVAPPVRLSQAPVLVLAEVDMNARLSQAPILVLAEAVPCLTHWAICVSIIRTDGQTFAFTDHDRPMTFNGLVHSPCNSLSMSASELGAILGSVGNIDMMGIISDDLITELDLLSGKFDGATVELWLVPWQGSEIPIRLNAGVTGNIVQGTVAFSMEALTAGARLQQQPLLQTYTPHCRFQLGDVRCTINLVPLTVTGAVTATAVNVASNLSVRRQFTDASRLEADRWFELGTIEWLSGVNQGLRSEVKSFVAGTFVLWQPTVEPIVIGDTYRAIPGCDKLRDTCIQKFNNFVNFGGFPDVPGKDALIRTPDSKIET
jgi:uncharacterized phage protein (TIGR02218 family)